MKPELIEADDLRGMSLHELEHIVDDGMRGFYKAGAALRQIKESSMYAQGKSLDGEEYATWEAYCVGRFGMSQQHVARLINASMVLDRLRTEPTGSVLPRQERVARPMGQLLDNQRGDDHTDAIPSVWLEAVEDAGGPAEVTAKHVQKAVNRYLGKADPEAVFSSDSEEWYTPRDYIESARKVLGGIDLDPASNPIANEWIGAAKYYSVVDDGLNQPWGGRVWCNPPYGKNESEESNQAVWTGRMSDEYEFGSVTAAIMLVTFVPDRRWFDLLWQYPMCAVGKRISFERADGTKGQSPTSANVFVYFGEDVHAFESEFSQYGKILIPSNKIVEVRNG